MFWSLVLGLHTEENRFSESTDLRDDSAESTKFHRFSTSLTDFYRVSNLSTPSLVSGIGIDTVRLESITNRPSRTGLGRFFEPCCGMHILEAVGSRWITSPLLSLASW